MINTADSKKNLIIILLAFLLVWGLVSAGFGSFAHAESNDQQVKTVWYSFNGLKLAVKVPNDLKIKAVSEDKPQFNGHNDRIKFSLRRWNQVSYPSLNALAKLVKEKTGRRVRKVKQGRLRMVKILGLKTKIKYYVLMPNGDDYILTIAPNKSNNPKLKFKDIKAEAKAIEASFRIPKKIPTGAKRIKLARTKFPKVNYLVLVNSKNKIPDKWTDKISMVKAVNTRGNTIRAERKTYKAYLKLKHEIEKKNDFRIDLDFGIRTVKEQQKLIDDYTKRYGAAYANRIAAKPGYSEHHTGLALDVYLIIDGKNIYLNEEMEKYPKVWKKIHAKLAKYGFILSYPKNSAYPYEPWHIRYVGKKAAKKIMDSGITLEQYLARS
ncbi:MAG: M15 family metallopeptidase [Firmicutes bacterium]|nr:M15 family metallopeptidase [Bacillota bacterium]